MNKLPKLTVETVIVPTKHRATNMLSVDEADNPELAIWMGRQEDKQMKTWKVQNHINEMSMKQKVTSLAPAHGKEKGSDGRFIHPVSNSRQTLLFD